MLLIATMVQDSPHVDRKQMADQGLGNRERDTAKEDEEERWPIQLKAGYVRHSRVRPLTEPLDLLEGKSASPRYLQAVVGDDGRNGRQAKEDEEAGEEDLPTGYVCQIS
jgi:hypothetical protein